MKRVAKSLVLVALMLAVALPLAADEKKAKKERKKRPSAAAAFLKRVAKAELTEEQVAEVNKIAAGLQDKIAAATKNVGLTAEQRKARAAASKKAKADGLKGKEAQAAIAKATNLTQQQLEAQAKVRAARAERQKAFLGVLTADQKKKAGLSKKRGKKPATKKPAKAAAKKADN
ncbi:MAG: Spy/CpxP family protein refolding chaperone [Planctomycetes bacterium]|nr:Spy/CpxP family protein refolding chaperone [Planctomycetota bacterium]